MLGCRIFTIDDIEEFSDSSHHHSKWEKRKWNDKLPLRGFTLLVHLMMIKNSSYFTSIILVVINTIKSVYPLSIPCRIFFILEFGVFWRFQLILVFLVYFHIAKIYTKYYKQPLCVHFPALWWWWLKYRQTHKAERWHM